MPPLDRRLSVGILQHFKNKNQFTLAGSPWVKLEILQLESNVTFLGLYSV